VAKARRVSGHFRSGIEAMIREAELEEMEKEWREQNRKIMAEHPGQEMTAMNASGTGPLSAAPPPAAEASDAPEAPQPSSTADGPPPPP
jgi:sec-independent protein translocase protein TatB